MVLLLVLNRVIKQHTGVDLEGKSCLRYVYQIMRLSHYKLAFTINDQ